MSSTRAPARPAADHPAADHWITADPATFDANFNRRTFAVRHTLAAHPHFQLPKLVELAQRTLRTRPQHVHCDRVVGDAAVGAGARFSALADEKDSAVRLLEQIERAGAWLVLYHAEADPEYREIFEHGLADIKRAIGRDVDADVMEEEIIIFVTSPNRVTPYHIDRNVNFLLQVRGSKTMHVFDRYDREVITEEELERNWAVDDKQPPYREHLQHRATTYHLRPGDGAHIPVNAPHWLANDDNVSVSLSVNFQYKDRCLGSIHRANYFLRRAGLRPTPPGVSAGKDRLKALLAPPLVRAATGVMRARQRARQR